MPNYNRKLNDWRPRSPLNALIERVLKRLQIRTDPRWMLFVTVLFLALLSGCAAKPPLSPGQPPKELMVPPPPPQAATNLLEAILRKGQTSAPTSTP